MHVVNRQLRVVGQELVERVTLSEEADHRGDRDAGTTNARHTAHDVVVGDDAGLGHAFSVGPRAVPGREHAFGR